MPKHTDRHIMGVDERLTLAIERSGVNIEQLSRKTDVDADHIKRLSRGNTVLREFDIARLCAALNISADWLLGITTTDARREFGELTPISEDFETMLICAERYACGRRTYMPSLVVGYITPLLPKLTVNTLRVLYLDIAGASDFGDESIDKPCWTKLLADVRAEIERRKQS